ncbi:hypothetical protein B0J13DRAFT_324740 [Dactylonectria estremocensis]|uniref:Centrosomin N-terminal motif 1 domain-containing protein n=1 Tax=Dactylonectria estremocensis TaxID=1079267 RepID=A0A9P9ERI1_9HYPO|nr:hypothetical protein B0J13DRAFT_324740 [Dactylonectria estremocensis]
MDSAHNNPYERSRPSYPRTASRSSTSTTNTRVTSQSANSSSSQIEPSPQMSGSHPSHRFHHSSCKTVSSPRSTPRATPRLSREASNESNRQQAVSTFLQERLQKERQVESEKSAVWSRGNSDLSASLELSRAGHGSPTKGGDLDMRRPQSTTSTESGKKKGLGVKDMEQVISSLHKQNFDLKLELYHRRERQTMMEERIEGLEAENTRVEEMNDKLMQDMEKRDKAVEEAVAMIITLEARLEQFAKERSMVQQIEAEGPYGLPDFESAYEHPAPRFNGLDVAKLEDDAKVITRMPSFLSERTENTENLRNVYLGVRGSVLSLPQVPGYADNNPIDGLASPSLSVLSESSFISVYGQKGPTNAVSFEVDEPLSLDGADTMHADASVIKRPKTSMAKAPMSNRPARSNSLTTTNRHNNYQPMNDIIDRRSPLQQIEHLDPTYSQKRAESHSQTQGKDADAVFTGRTVKPPSSPARKRTREEKRESLRRVLTDAPGGVRLHDLPPTPDTISTSTLRRFQNSNDTLSKQPATQLSYDDFSDFSGNEKQSEGVPLGDMMEMSAKPLEKARDLNNSAYYETRARAIQRPRSADETTVSNRRANDWDSDSDDSDTRSLQSSLDIWMRESAKPESKGRNSPDLFSFPTTGSKGSWAVDAMFGPKLSQQGVLSTGLDPERIIDMFPVQPELFSASLPPPPPNRRSSLLAQTGNSPQSSRPSTKRGASKASSRRNGHNRRNSDDIQMRAEMKTPVQPSLPVPPQATTEQRKQYPPIANQQSARNPLTKLWRRSLGGGTPSTAPEPVAHEMALEAPKTNGGMGVPSWVSRSAAGEDDRDGATPPPIMRNPRQSRHMSVDLSASVRAGSQEPQPPCTPTMPPYMRESATPEQPLNSPRVPSATGTRRKWLPALRAASFMARNG